MSFTEFSKKLLMNYFIIVTGITVAIAMLGMNLYPEETLRYDAFFSPLIFGAVATLPYFVFYSRKELTFRQMLIRKILHFLLLEITQISLGYLSGLLKNLKMMVMLFVAVFAVYLFKLVINWLMDSKTAMDINEGLKRIQE